MSISQLLAKAARGAETAIRRYVPLVRPEASEDIAIAHDYLTQRGGAERVVLAMHKAFPEATIYTTLYDPEGTFPEFKDAKIVTSPLNRVSFLRKNHRMALPLLPIASSLLKVPAQRAVVSTTGWAHGFNFAARKFIYCHSPARWLYLSDQYLGEKSTGPVPLLLKTLRPALTAWDKHAASKSSCYVANASVIQQRIHDVYGKEAPVFHPPHSVDINAPVEPLDGLEEFTKDEDYFLIVSRLLPYKNVDKAIEACNATGAKLLVIGRGPEKENLEALAGPTVRIASGVSDAQLRYAYRHCRALLAISYEDFGITPLEAGASGKAVIAYRAGGFLDTIVEGVTGVFIDEPTVEQLSAAIEAFDPDVWDDKAIRAHVDQFSQERFIRRLRDYVAALPEEN
ncbi:MAG: glycosyltransferase [Rothia sp. (in: high G+C Gram-positive bacteria)]|uniref:glycosyltransferase n=1 Tax=Rothia sp. (in: high G+C Gram-positive bacteria) TaxID=1885016 RepID=UPI0026DEBEC2|nr:glycosyltransferase [Rothia sp. (in: high G+C Gram-positive bacteria)]MDO5750282.1 glycosyltransferase [Rothia sp. (in: high G+C Gram-positive bacteria)]